MIGLDLKINEVYERYGFDNLFFRELILQLLKSKKIDWLRCQSVSFWRDLMSDRYIPCTILKPDKEEIIRMAFTRDASIVETLSGVFSGKDIIDEITKVSSHKFYLSARMFIEKIDRFSVEDEDLAKFYNQIREYSELEAAELLTKLYVKFPNLIDMDDVIDHILATNNELDIIENAIHLAKINKDLDRITKHAVENFSSKYLCTYAMSVSNCDHMMLSVALVKRGEKQYIDLYAQFFAPQDVVPLLMPYVSGECLRFLYYNNKIDLDVLMDYLITCDDVRVLKCFSDIAFPKYTDIVNRMINIADDETLTSLSNTFSSSRKIINKCAKKIIEHKDPFCISHFIHSVKDNVSESTLNELITALCSTKNAQAIAKTLADMPNNELLLESLIEMKDLKELRAVIHSGVLPIDVESYVKRMCYRLEQERTKESLEDLKVLVHNELLKRY